MKIILWSSIVLAVGAYICGPIVDPDLWWHITVGRWIVSHGQIPHTDHWNMFALGQPWRAYSWSNEILFALVDGRFGAHGLLVLKIIFSVLISASLCTVLSRISRDWFFGTFFGVIAAAACYNHFTLRPQSLVWVYFVWLIYVADLIAESGWTWKRKLALVTIMVLWANSHLSAALGIAVVFAWLVKDRKIGDATMAALLCFAGTLITPYLGGEWITFFAKSGHPFSHSGIIEFQPANIKQHSTGFLILLAAFLAVFVQRRPLAARPARLLICGAFWAGALAVVKFLPFADILTAAVIADIWRVERGEAQNLGHLAEAIRRFQRMFERIPREGLSFLLLCTVAVNVNSVWQAPISREVIPVDAVDFMQAKSLAHPVLNDFGRGGYMMYRYSDRNGELAYPVPVDGRTNVNTPEISRASTDATWARRNWQDFFNLVKPSTVIWDNGSPLVTVLIVSPDWCRVFSGGADQRSGYSVFVSREQFEKRRTDLSSSDCP